MQTIPVTVSNKIASVPCGTTIVANNNNYCLRISFDAEWDAYPLKTARFVINGEYTDIDFSGDVVNVPAVTDSSLYEIQFGVYAGELSTTTPARLLVFSSVLGIPTSGQYQPDDPGTLLPNIEELALADTFVATDVSEGIRGRATMQQVVDLAEEQFGVEPSNNVPLGDGTASAGYSAKYARGDHRHPTDVTLANQITSLNNKATRWDAKYGPDTPNAIPASALAPDLRSTISHTAEAVENKVDKIEGYGLSENDYDDVAKAKVDAIPADPKYTDTTYTAGNGITISAQNVISADAGLFDVIPNVTTFAAISTAKRDGKLPTIKGTGSRIYIMTYLGTTYATFESTGLVEAGGVWSYKVTSGNVWSSSAQDFYNATETESLYGSPVKYTAQSLTDAQKAQARANIGAVSLSDIGTPMTFKGAVATVSDLPATDNREGDVYFVVADSAEYVWLITSAHSTGYWEEFGESIDMSGFVATTAQTLTSAQQVQARTNIDAAQEPLVAVYGTTGSADIEAAWQAGRAVYCDYNSNRYELSGRAGAQAHVFTAVGNGTIMILSCANGTWTNSSKSIPSAATAAPADLAASAAVGSSSAFARSDHVHKMPSASDVGALASDTTYVSTVNGNSGDVTVPVPSASSATPEALGTAAAGSSSDYSRADHVHAMPTAANVGAIAAPSSPATGAFLVWDGSAWTAQTLATWQGGNY